MLNLYPPINYSNNNFKNKILLLILLSISNTQSWNIKNPKINKYSFKKNNIQLKYKNDNKCNFWDKTIKPLTGIVFLSYYITCVKPSFAIETELYQDNIEWRYSDFINRVLEDSVEKVNFSSDGKKLIAIDNEGVKHNFNSIPNDPNLIDTLVSHNVDVTVLNENNNLDKDISNSILTILLPSIIFGIIFFLSRNSQNLLNSQSMNPMNFGKSISKIEMNPNTGVNFEDVAGCEQAKLELEETVDFLKNPERYTKMGAKIPKGVLLDGPPGTGKTLLAKAVAGEAGVPFFAVSGSEFVEMFVGVGASRVRDLFSQAKKNAPCIIFIDEIDAVGRQRGAGFAQGNDEREQTLNQILTEMDGFDGNGGIITIGATNRVDILDNALTRPGRFDRKVTVDLPNLDGRIDILKVHSRDKPFEKDVDFNNIARRTPGYSGASLQNLLNEAAIYTARAGKSKIGYDEIEYALDKNMVGLEKKNTIQSCKQKELVSFHEAGHAICGAMIPDYDQVQKITIIPRSNGAGGLTFFAPSESRIESGLYSRQYLESQLIVALGGRIAEEIIFGEIDITVGASNDLQQVSTIANNMVMEWGMNDNIGPISIKDSGQPPFMGKSMNQPTTEWSKDIIKKASLEVELLVSKAYNISKKIIINNKQLLDIVAKKLIEQETINSDEFNILVKKYGKFMSSYELFNENNDKFELPFQNIDVYQ